MRYPAAEKLEIIRLVEESTLPVRRTLEKLGIPRATFYRWYDLCQTGGPEAPVLWRLFPGIIRRFTRCGPSLRHQACAAADAAEYEPAARH
jgi:Homeodomain-like domain